VRYQTGLLCVAVTMLTALLAGCAASPKTTAPFLTQSTTKYSDPLDTPKASAAVACKH
jgi:hypothetical protein